MWRSSARTAIWDAFGSPGTAGGIRHGSITLTAGKVYTPARTHHPGLWIFPLALRVQPFDKATCTVLSAIFQC